LGLLRTVRLSIALHGGAVLLHPGAKAHRKYFYATQSTVTFGGRKVFKRCFCGSGSTPDQLRVVLAQTLESMLHRCAPKADRRTPRESVGGLVGPALVDGHGELTDFGAVGVGAAAVLQGDGVIARVAGIAIFVCGDGGAELGVEAVGRDIF
jgi:hypothetical protein